MYQELADRLKCFQNHTVAVISHIRPDADCIGSQVALCRWLKKNGINAKAFNDDELPPNLKWLNEHFPIVKTDPDKLMQADAYVFVDGNTATRFGKAGEVAEKSGKPLFMIDHHPDPDTNFDIAISDVKASSTCELIFNLYELEEYQLDLPSAEAMYAGIMTDTGSFRFDSVSARTHEAVAIMITKAGLKTEPIHRKIFDGRTLNQLQLMAKVLSSVKMHHDGRIATMSVTQALLKETETTYNDLEGLVNYGLGIAGVQAAILFSEMDDKIKMSLRSNSHIDVNEWARQLDGGGHVKAAGAVFKGSIEEAVETTVAVGAKQLN